MDDTQAAREAFEAWWKSNPACRYDADRMYPSAAAWDAWLACWLAASRSIPAAAALLREAGWTVEEPKCKTCGGKGTIYGSWEITCPAYNGPGARKVTT